MTNADIAREINELLGLGEHISDCGGGPDPLIALLDRYYPPAQGRRQEGEEDERKIEVLVNTLNSSSKVPFAIHYKDSLNVDGLDHILEVLVLIRNYWADNERQMMPL